MRTFLLIQTKELEEKTSTDFWLIVSNGRGTLPRMYRTERRDDTTPIDVIYSS